MTEPSSESEFQGTWVQAAPRRLFGQILLGLATTGALVGFGLLIHHQTFDAMAVLVGFTIVALLTYLALSSSSPTTVTLAGPRLTVRCGGDIDEFDLAGPIRRINTIGFPNRPNWRVRLEAHDGKIVELGPTQVDPDLMQAAIARYRVPTIPQQRNGSQSPPATPGSHPETGFAPIDRA